MKTRLLHFLLLTTSLLHATQEFTLEHMKSYLTEENPYIYAALGKQNIAQEKLNYSLGQYDTTIKAKYDEKEYPLSEGTYYSMSLEKPTELGVDLSFGYRYAQGVQEYNNIKTGKNGEFLAGAKIPLISLLNQIDRRRLRVSLSKMDLKKSDFAFQEAMRSFYFKLMSDYFRLLHDKEQLELSKTILKKRKERAVFLQKSVKEGNLAESTLLEASQQIISAQQNTISDQRVYQDRFYTFLQYLNLSKKLFEERYHLPRLPDVHHTKLDIETLFKTAQKNRPDIQILNTQIEKLFIENKNNERKKYPEFNIGLYGIYDVNDKSGFKLSLDMNFPVAQNQYKSKSAQIKESPKLLNNAKLLQLLEMKTDLLRIINALNAAQQKIKSSQEELKLLLKLEKLEERKYTLGSSTLFLLNQRERLRVETQKKVLYFKLEYQLLYQSFKQIMNQNRLQG